MTIRRASSPIIIIAAILSITFLLPGCAATPPRPAVINHPVFFTLNDPADTDELIADCDALLPAIPQVISYYCGRPFDSGRDTVDHNYHVGLYVGFNSEEDYAAYVAHPNHVELVTTWRPRIKTLRVHDIADYTR